MMWVRYCCILIVMVCLVFSCLMWETAGRAAGEKVPVPITSSVPAYPVRLVVTVEGTDGTLVSAWDRTLPYIPEKWSRIDLFVVDDVSYSTALERLVIHTKTVVVAETAEKGHKTVTLSRGGWKRLIFTKGR